MALQMTTTFHGVSVTDAYHKVNWISGSKNGINVSLRVYKDAAESADPGAFLKEINFEIPAADLVHDNGSNDKNYIKQAYNYLKAAEVQTSSGMVDYTSATDV